MREFFHLSIDAVKDRIRTELPDLPADRINLIDRGWSNTVAIVNSEWVLRFPKTPASLERLKFEVKLLQYIKDFPFKVPDYVYFSKEKPYFAMYPAINGNPLNSARLLTLPLLNDMHKSILYMADKNESSLKHTGIEIFGPESWVKREESILNHFQDKLVKYLGTDFFTSSIDKLHDTLENTDETAFNLIHGDFYRENVLISDTMNSMNGVIDWGESVIGDYALDVAALGVDFSISQNRKIMERVGREDRNLMERVKFYQHVEPLYRASLLEENGESGEAKRICDSIRMRQS